MFRFAKELTDNCLPWPHLGEQADQAPADQAAQGPDEHCSLNRTKTVSSQAEAVAKGLDKFH